MSGKRPQIRIVHWQNAVPTFAACTVCNRLFSVPPDTIPNVESARFALEMEFRRHLCPTPQKLAAPAPEGWRTLSNFR